MEQSKWYKNAIFYEIYLRSYKDGNNDGIGDISGLKDKLDYIKALGVDCIWLLPIYPSPRKDDGYDIADYYSIDPVYGTLEEFKELVNLVHRKGMRIVMDLVVNHTSDQHPWFQSARMDPNSPYRDYYVWSDTDQKYQDARIIFIDIEKSNWTWDSAAKKYYWHRFYSSQPDLNYENPKVKGEMLNIIGYWLDLGIDGFRVDAVPYLFEKDGTNCENLPETHEYLKEVRHFVDQNYPGKILFCEANQLPTDVVEYLGNDDEFHMAFHFPLMPKIFMGLRLEDKTPVEETIMDIPPIPQNCQWGTFLRNHDELTLEMVTPEDRDWMWQEYAPEPRMRLNLGIRRRLAPLLDNNQGKIELAYNILFSLPGSPFIYYGDEIGMGEDLSLPDRDGVRTPMQWDDSVHGGFSKMEKIPMPVIADPMYAPERVNVSRNIENQYSLWHHIRRMINIRKQETVFLSNDISFLDTQDKRIMALIRKNEDEELYFIHNLSDANVELSPSTLAKDKILLKDLMTGVVFTTHQNSKNMTLNPWQSFILKRMST